jgi:hypothetical protein
VSEIEQTPRAVLAPQEPYRADDRDAGADFARLADWLASHWVPVAGVLMVAAQTAWMSVLVGHSFFWIEDFYMLQRAANDGLTWNYLMWLMGGHMMPVSNLITWFLTRAWLYDWTPFAAVTLVLSAVSGLMLLRLLRTLFGDRPGILLPLVLSLLSPLVFEGLSWWVVSSVQLPFQIAVYGAVTSHVRYVRTGRWRALAATAGWVVLGMASSDKGLAIPLLLFGITSAFLAPGSWRRAGWEVLRRYWRAWALFGVAMAGYVAIYLVQLPTSSSGFQSYHALSGVVPFTWTLITASLFPGLLGGPWSWWILGGRTGIAMAGAPEVLVWLALGASVIIFAASLAIRRRAWRAWVVLLCWVVFVDVLPTLLGRGLTFSGTFLGHETRYLMEVPGIVAILACLLFLPTAGTAGAGTAGTAGTGAGRVPRPVGRRTVAILTSLVTVVTIGSIWSSHTYVDATTHVAGRSYLATARVALTQVPSGTFIVNSPVPMNGVFGVLGGLLPGPLSSDTTAAVLGPLLAGKTGIRFVNQPDGTFDKLMEFDGWGRLVPAGIYGPANAPIRSCWTSTYATINVAMAALPAPVAEMRIGYLAAFPGELTISYAGQTTVLPVSKGLHTAFIPVQRNGRVVSVTDLTPGAVCIGNVSIGYLWPSSSGTAIPVAALSG